MILRLGSRSCWSGWVRWPSRAYDLTRWRPPAQFEDLVELQLVAGELGGLAAGLGPSSRGGGDQYGLGGGGELAEQFADAHMQPRALGFAAHQVGQLPGQDAGEDLDPDALLGPLG